MSVAAILSAYRRAMDRFGEAVVMEGHIKPNRPRPSAPTRAHILEYRPIELGGGITAGMRRAIILHEDLEDTPFASGPEKLMRIVWNGRTLTITEVDNGTRRIGGVPIAYQCRLTGA